MMISRCILQKASSRAGLARSSFSSSATDKSMETMLKLFNSQITKEMNASQLYLSASIWCSEKEYTGMASYMLKESTEERNHALELVDFGLKRDFSVELEALEAPHAHWQNAEALWTDILEAEKTNTQALFELASAAQTCHDHALVTFLQPFHTEQVNAVAEIKTIVAKVQEETLTPGLIRQLDTELGADV